MESENLHMITKVWTNICRFVLAVVFVFSGFVKAVDPLGSVYKIQDYLEAFGMASWFPFFIVLIIAVGLSTLEFVLGIMLLFGTKQISTSILTLAFMLVMTPLTLYLAIANPVSDCGCFGDAWVLTNWQTFWKNIFLLIAAVSIFVWQNKMIRFVSVTSQWLIMLYSILFIVGISIYSLQYLPILDFRPYKIGNNILKEMSIPEGESPSVYETVFVLQKDGKKKEFNLENYPDSTWKFVDTRLVLKEKGYEPTIQDFYMLSLETGADISAEVLSNPSYTFLLLSPRIEEASDNNIDLINEIYDYSVDRGYSFYAMTSSSDFQIEQWRDRTGAQYPFCFADEIALKTIVRSNPGLLLMKDAVILNKWSHEALPDEYELTDALENIELGKQKEIGTFNTIGIIFMWYFVPLLIVMLLDFAVVRKKIFHRKRQKEIN
ncbi:DoxX family protein [Bacteroides sp. 214]|uniref:BT_3928 family protein n=1 Tax=Bacteroides sp. 214 TaxID=2302935 RepID=UPI0013D4EF9C|nr:BT_3928 family protein [Bacteroides sp. 214]NDW12314.1 DoxX family protein [Bacteroides sp. 214]